MPTEPLPKGIVSFRFAEYAPLLEMLHELGAIVYQITGHFA